MATYIEYYEIKTPHGVEYYFAHIENESAMGYLPGNTLASREAIVATVTKSVFKSDSNRIWRYNTETEEVRWMKNVDVGLMAPVDMDEFRGIQWMSAQNNISNSIIDHNVTTTKFINEFIKANKPYR